MNKFTQKWAVVAMLEPVKDGTVFHYTDWPSHITIIGVFGTKDTGLEIAEKIAKILTDQKFVKVTADKLAFFGPEKNIKVMTIQKTKELIELHNKLYSLLVQSGAVFIEPQYQADGFLPHSTVQKHAQLNPGDTDIIKSLATKEK
jgi:2'-5' RNA ligase